MNNIRKVYYYAREYPDFASSFMREYSNCRRKQDANARVSRAMRESWQVCTYGLATANHKAVKK